MGFHLQLYGFGLPFGEKVHSFEQLGPPFLFWVRGVEGGGRGKECVMSPKDVFVGGYIHLI